MASGTRAGLARAATVPGQAGIGSFFAKKRPAEPDKDQENLQPIIEVAAPKRSKTTEATEAADQIREVARPKRSKTVAVEATENAGQVSVHDRYQKKTQLEHILLRPDSYVGSIEKQAQEHFVVDPASGRMTRRKIEYVPSLFKIFDEILVNAADNRIRCPEQNTMAVEINTSNGWVSVMNNGKGIPVEMHRDHGIYVPELIFGHLLTSDNYDDSEKKVVGGRNGYGAKLTNIFSTKFILETSDSKSGKYYKQVWENNMTKCNPPLIKKTDCEDFTKITFYPDFKRFQMTHLDEGTADLFRRRVYDISACVHGQCQVSLDGKLLEASSFQDYVGLYVHPENFRVNEVVNERWEVAVGLTDGSGFQQVSFVNSINTSSGGTHVNYVSDQVVNAILEKTSKSRSGGLAVKAAHVKSYLWVFVNCLIENPSFSSQAKEMLTLKRDKFGSTCEVPAHMLTSILESGIVERLQEWSKAMGKSELAQHLNRSDLSLQKRLFGVPKLDDANMAGTVDSPKCTLILTEGDSAKALAVAGLSIVGRDHYGVFPLRGKLRNVRDLSDKQLRDNKEIDQIMKILALDINTEYRSTNGLRYGSIMIMTDQDYDGSHIKGLIINFIQHWFPSLLKLPGFMKEFVTPIVKVSKGTDVNTFFTVPEYEAWKATTDNNAAGWKSKYYKGLGTSTAAEAKEYFTELDDHEISFAHKGPEEDDLIDMAFNSKRADDRKQWISECQDGTFVDHNVEEMSYTDFIKKELVLFAKYDVQRAVPCLVDGLKPGQRKVLFGVFKRKLTSDVKVAQLSGYIAEHSAYHHGETSLQGTIIGMAQNFVGSNNVNLLLPMGQFGTRLQGGKDHAASRYIFTKPSRALRAMFSEEDDPILEYQNDEGLTIEPRWYCPVIPLVLVNGADGIGTGWSTSIPNYNPREIIANIRRHLRGESMEPLVPWYRGFKGTVAPVPGNPGKYEVTGVANTRGRVMLEITELPVKMWTQDYKEKLLDQLPQAGAEERARITEIREYHTENSVHFVLAMTPDKVAEAERTGFEKAFKLKSSVSTTNMFLFNHEGHIQKYSSPEEIIEAFIPTRLETYRKRKAHMLNKMEREVATISNRLKFVQLVITDRLEVEKRKTNELCNEMHRKGLQTMSEILGGEPVKDGSPDGYKYLLSMKMWSLTEDKVKALQNDRDKKNAALEELKATTLEALWEKDLVKLETALDACDADDRKEAEEAEKLIKKKMGGEDLLVNRQCVLVLTSNYEAKRVRASTWKARKRGKKMDNRNVMSGKRSKKGDDTKEETQDVAEEDEDEEGGAVEDSSEGLAGVFCCYDFDALLVFSENGMVYKLQALDVPLAKTLRTKGTLMKEFLPELGDNKIAAIVTVDQRALRDQSDEFVVLVSSQGLAKKVTLDKFRGLRAGHAIQCFKLLAGDKLRWAHRASGQNCLVMASASGSAMRCSIGAEWKPRGAKTGGVPGMKVNSKGDDWVAASTIAKLSNQEMARHKKLKEAASAKRRAQRLAREAAGAETHPGGSVGAAPDGSGAVPPHVSPKKPSACDDDDSDNGEVAMEVDAGKEEKESEAGEDGDELGSEGEKADKDGEDDDEAMDAEDQDEAKVAEDANDIDGTDDQCILLVTEMGFGIRMPMTCPRMGLTRRGGRGRRCMKLLEGVKNDNIVAVCSVSNRGEVKRPPKWREPHLLYHYENKAKQEEEAAEGKVNAVADATGSADTPPEAVAEEGTDTHDNDDTQQQANDVWTFSGVMAAVREKFNALSEELRQEYQVRSDEERKVYEAQCAEITIQEAQEEILLGTTKGNITRVTVGSIPIVSSLRKGKILVKLQKGDRLCTVSLLSSVDEADDDGKPKAPAPPPSGPSRPARPRAPKPQPLAQDGSAAVPAEAEARAASSTAVFLADQEGPAQQDGPTLQPFAASSPAGKKAARRANKAVATPTAVEKLRSRLSHMARSSPRPSLSGSGRKRISDAQSARLSIVKPKLRLLSQTRKTLKVRSLDVRQWAVMAAAAAVVQR